MTSGGLLRAAVMGAGLGAFSALGDRLPADTPLVVLIALANAVGPWVVVAFLAGAGGRAGREGAVLGAVALLVAVTGYYLASQVAWEAFVDPIRATAVWGAVALVVGAPLGAAGALWSVGDRRGPAAVGLLSGLLLAEALVRFVEVEGWTGYDLGRTALQVAAVNTIVAALGPVLLLRANRAVAYAVALGVGVGGAAILAVLVPVIRDAAAG